MTVPSPSSPALPLRGLRSLDDIPHPQPHRVPHIVDEHDLGAVIRHASNLSYLRWGEQASEAHAHAMGCSLEFLAERGLMWFVVRHEIDYLAECFLGDELTICTWVHDVEHVRSWRHTCIARESDGRMVCVCRTLWVLVDLATRRAVRIPDEITTAMLRHVASGPGASECTSD